jgi:two-component sensor histidine kinase
MATTLRDTFPVTRYSFWAGALLSSLVGGLLYVMTSRSIESDAENRFISHARHAQSVINIRVKSYTDLLRATGSMIQSSNVLTYQNFHEFVHGLDLSKNFPAVDYINYAVQVPHETRDAFVYDLRANVSGIVGKPVDIDISPPGIRPSYLVVAFVEPAPPSVRYYGIDLMANRYFGNQLQLERDSGKIFSSGTPIPMLSRPNNIYMGMRMPVYRKSLPLQTVEQRRAAYAGSLGIAFSIPKLLNGAMDEIPIKGLRMTLYDVGPGIDARGRPTVGKPLPLFDSLGTSANPTPALDGGDGVFSVTLPLDFNGRPWNTTFSAPKAALYTGFDDYYPKLMMAFGFLGSILLYALLHTLTSSRRAALALAQEMTSELRESQGKLQLSHQKLRRLADHAYHIKEMERKRIAREIHDDHGEIALPDHCATAFFRILQESLTNIVRHANASRVKVELRLNGGWLSLTVRDNGCGLPPGGRNKYGSFGLVGIEERIVILGGTCAVFNEPDGGTTVTVSAPVAGGQEHPSREHLEHGPGPALI